MFNIFNFNKTISNPSKLDRDLKNNVEFGSLHLFLNIKGSNITVHFSSNLNQNQIDALSSFISSYSDISVYDTLYSYLKSDVDPFVTDLLIRIRAENIEMGITQSNKTLEVLGFFEERFIIPGRVRAVSLQSSLQTGSLTVTLELLTYLIANPQLYSDINPYVTAERLDSWKSKIIDFLS